MIVTVRVAPFEKWCESQKDYPYDWDRKPDGVPISIVTETMRQSDWCNGNAWLVADLDEVRARVGLKPARTERRYICEHMLEMD